MGRLRWGGVVRMRDEKTGVREGEGSEEEEDEGDKEGCHFEDGGWRRGWCCWIEGGSSRLMKFQSWSCWKDDGGVGEGKEQEEGDSVPQDSQPFGVELDDGCVDRVASPDDITDGRSDLVHSLCRASSGLPIFFEKAGRYDRLGARSGWPVMSPWQPGCIKSCERKAHLFALVDVASSFVSALM
jgi:hypothetical protein